MSHFHSHSLHSAGVLRGAAEGAGKVLGIAALGALIIGLSPDVTLLKYDDHGRPIPGIWRTSTQTRLNKALRKLEGSEGQLAKYETEIAKQRKELTIEQGRYQEALDRFHDAQRTVDRLQQEIINRRNLNDTRAATARKREMFLQNQIAAQTEKSIALAQRNDLIADTRRRTKKTLAQLVADNVALKATVSGLHDKLQTATKRIQELLLQIARRHAPASHRRGATTLPPLRRSPPLFPTLAHLRFQVVEDLPGGYLELRAAATPFSPELRRIPSNASNLFATGNTARFNDPNAGRRVLWYEVLYDGTVGWVCGSYLIRIPD